jgi:hypothetical protein
MVGEGGEQLADGGKSSAFSWCEEFEQTMSDVIIIKPDAGSFTDPSGNVFSINAADHNTANINGQPVTPNGESTNTGTMELANGSVFGQDQNTGQWYLLASKGTPGLWEWQPVSAPPDSTTVGSNENFVLSSGNAATTALGNDQAAMVFVGGGSSGVTAVSPSSTNSSQDTSGLLTPGDFQQSTGGSSLSTNNSLQGSLQAAPDGTGGTMLTLGTCHSTDLHGVTAIPTSH